MIIPIARIYRDKARSGGQRNTNDICLKQI